MCSKLLLDHAGEWHRTAKSIQANQNLFKIRSTPTEAKQTGYMNDQSTESKKAESLTPAFPNATKDCVKNSLENV